MSTDTTPSITKVLSQLQNLTEPSNFTIAQKDDRYVMLFHENNPD